MTDNKRKKKAIKINSDLKKLVEVTNKCLE